jgi:hypothetical protein
MPRFLQVAVALVATAGAAYAAYMLALFLPLFIELISRGMTWLGPRSYNSIVNWGGDLKSVWPFVAQDMGIFLMIVTAFRLMNRLEAAALAFGLILVLVYEFLTLVNFMCATVVLALAAIDDPVSFRCSRWLVVAAFLLTSPAMIFTDETGLSTGLFWFAIIAAVPLVTIDCARFAGRRTRPERRQHALIVSTLLTVTILALLASARGMLVLSAGWFGGADLTPQVREIWQAVRERVPPNALVFTDETGRDHGLLGGWNAYVLHGQRQVFISFPGSRARSSKLYPAERDARLQMNDDVLSGQLDPTRVKTSRPYSSFFAVVSVGRHLPPRWHRIYANRDHVLYQWDP